MITRLFWLLLIGVWFFMPSPTYAHPTDETDTFFYIAEDEFGNPIPENEVWFDVALNWFQVSVLVQEEIGDTVIELQELRNFADTYVSFTRDNLFITSVTQECEISQLRLASEEESGPISMGIFVRGVLSCNEPVEAFTVENRMFLGASPTQANRIHLARGREDLVMDSITINTPIITISVVDKKIFIGGSVSEQGSVDDSSNADSSSSNKSPWFSLPTSDELSDQLIGASAGWIFIVVFLLGLLHTLEAGHSKAILASAMVDKRMSIRQGMLYAVVFTVTHIADIVAMGILFIVIGAFTDIYRSFAQLQTFSAYALLFIALYLLQKNVVHLIQHRYAPEHHHHHDDHDHSSEHGHSHGEELLEGKHVSFKEQLTMGFVTGLAPCVFGWSVFMLILTSQNVWVLIPSILFFGLGIFTTLIFFVLLIGHAKGRFFNKVEWFGRWSPLVSSLLMVGYALLLIL